MDNIDLAHPLGYDNKINPVVIAALTLDQAEWLRQQCCDLNAKKLQVLRQALLEWAARRPEYHLSEEQLGLTMRQALGEFIERHDQGAPAS